MALLEMQGATLSFSDRVLWSNLDLLVERGEFIALIGANGSGKSMLLKTILGQQELSSGQIRFQGKALARGSTEIGYIPQHRSLDSELPLKVSDLVRFGLDGHKPGISFPSRIQSEKVLVALKQVDAEHLANEPVGKLSGGEMQRVRVAQALISKPKLLLADEPLSALDLGHQAQISELIAETKAKETAVIFVTHDVNPIIEYVDRVLYLASGRYSIGTPDEVLQSSVLSELYGTEIDVVRNQGRVVVLGAHDHGHHEDEQWV